MANLIKLVQRGYQIVGSSEFIPASELIPVGMERIFSKGDSEESITDESIPGLVKEYINRMGFSYGEYLIEGQFLVSL